MVTSISDSKVGRLRINEEAKLNVLLAKEQNSQNSLKAATHTPVTGVI